MGLFDLFTGDPLKNAAGQNRQTLLNAQGSVGNIADITRTWNEDTLRGGYNNARQDLGTGYRDSLDAINRGVTNSLGYLEQGQQGALGQLGQARSDLTAGGGAYAPLNALATRYGAGGNLYADSLGLNGAEGNTRAVSAFQAGPSYQNTLSSGIDALARLANAQGMGGGGGNANRSAIDYATNLANREYGSWQDRLRGIGDQELTATQGAAAGNQANNTTLANLGVTGANLYSQGGRDRAGVSTTQGQNLADLARQYYGSQAGLDTGEAGALANNMSNAGQWNVNAQMGLAPKIGQTFVDAGQAQVNGSANLWNLGMNAAKLAAGAAGGGGASAGFSGSAISGSDPYAAFANTLPFGGPR